MASDRDDRWGGGDDLRRGDRSGDSPEEIRRRAAEKLATPANLMIASGILMLILSVVGVGLIFSGYDFIVATLEVMRDFMPDEKSKAEMNKEIEKAKTRDKTIEYVQNAIFGVIGFAFDILVLLGGLRMKAMRGHTLAMIGSIAAIIPLNSCCCIGIPVGIWSLATLMNADVKAAFALNARGVAGSRDQADDGWGADR